MSQSGDRSSEFLRLEKPIPELPIPLGSNDPSSRYRFRFSVGSALLGE